MQNSVSRFYLLLRMPSSLPIAGIIRIWNKGAERIFGSMAEEAIGQSLDLIIPEKLQGDTGTATARLWRPVKRGMGPICSPCRHSIRMGPGSPPNFRLCCCAMRRGTRLGLQRSCVMCRRSGREKKGCKTGLQSWKLNCRNRDVSVIFNKLPHCLQQGVNNLKPLSNDSGHQRSSFPKGLNRESSFKTMDPR